MLFKKLFKSEEKAPEARRRRSSSQNKGERTKLNRKHREKIDVKDLRVGMFVVELDKPWEESSFMFQGLEIKSTSDITDAVSYTHLTLPTNREV